eukprot:scaffold1468_cov105-Pinguiococcus_pyrenoidosus.AAC.1
MDFTEELRQSSWSALARADGATLTWGIVGATTGFGESFAPMETRRVHVALAQASSADVPRSRMKCSPTRSEGLHLQ